MKRRVNLTNDGEGVNVSGTQFSAGQMQLDVSSA